MDNGSKESRGRRSIPYRLPQLLDFDRSEPIWIPEGEKCVDILHGLGLQATCASEGAGKWTADLNHHFADRIAWIVPDADEPGRKHAIQVASNLHGIAKEVRIVELPVRPDGGSVHIKADDRLVEIASIKDGEDVSEFIEKGGDAKDLRRLGELAPIWQPPQNGEGIGQGPEGLHEKPDEPNGARIVITLAEFLAKYDPPDYLVEGLLQKHYLYSLTGVTGSGKTAIAPLLAVLIALRTPGQRFGPNAVEHGRVVYIAAENATDVQMRFPPLLTRFKVQPDDLDLLIIDSIKNIDKDYARIERDIREFGDVDLIIVDTSPRLFLGDNFNDDKQMLDHAVRLRQLTKLPGSPCVLANGHPIKRPGNPEDLLPKGGGAYLNEVDGNLTLWKHDGFLTDLHWAGKFRGPDFQPITFRLDVSYSTANVDKKGNVLPTVTATYVTDAESDAVEASTAKQEIELLGAIQDKPRGTLIAWAISCGWFLKGDRTKPNKQQVYRIIKSAKDAGLIKKTGRAYTITASGKTALAKDETKKEDAA